jgi:pre-rRNA-processing protein TSR4
MGGKGGFCALRCQLGRTNDFYPLVTDEMAENEVVINENEGGMDCSMFNSAIQFPHFEIVTESELDCLNDCNENIMKKFDDQVEKVMIKEENIKGDEITGKDVKEAMNTLPKAVNDGIGESMTFFHHRVSVAKDQCIRYSRWNDGEELWTSNNNRPDIISGIPLCPLCHGERRFEFQVMPQLLFHIDAENSLGLGDGSDFDWGTIAVYTCSNSCGGDGGETNYYNEYVWCQEMPVGKEE